VYFLEITSNILVLRTGWTLKSGSYVKANCNVICIEEIEKKLMINLTLLIKVKITLTFLEIFLNNTSTPSNFIQFHFNNLPNTQFNLSHICLIYLVSVFSFATSWMRFFRHNGETIRFYFTNKQNQTLTIIE